MTVREFIEKVTEPPPNYFLRQLLKILDEFGDEKCSVLAGKIRAQTGIETGDEPLSRISICPKWLVGRVPKRVSNCIGRAYFFKDLTKPLNTITLRELQNVRGIGVASAYQIIHAIRAAEPTPEDLAGIKEGVKSCKAGDMRPWAEVKEDLGIKTEEEG